MDPTEPFGSRESHAILDIASRVLKAKKISMVLPDATGNAPARLLDIGCGAGVIAHYFGDPNGHAFACFGVDIRDSRIVKDHYEFHLVDNNILPFEDASFDYIVSNHVFEHVGDELEQLSHLSEIRRLLKPSGAAYFAVPCRWMIVEPHYRLPFLSWVPKWVADIYVKLKGARVGYDCSPPTKRKLELAFEKAGLDYENIGLRMLMLSAEVEGAFVFSSQVMERIPSALRSGLSPFFPTLCYLLRSKNS